MRATVYRNLDALSSIAGLALPYEAGLVGLVVVLGIAWLPIAPTIALAGALYLAIRLGNRGHHPGYLQDLLPHLLRRAAGGGRFSAGARARRSPAFPFAPRFTRDVPGAS
ncbi:MAG: hypothetical protein Q8L14_03225 [Myxococcales bacterium]|nr:hypothetical protein [Myxococcales bacterium]